MSEWLDLRWTILTAGYLFLAAATFALDAVADARLRARGCEHGIFAKEVFVGVAWPVTIPVFSVLYALGRTYPPDCRAAMKALRR